jgi:hypothetical protein
MLLAWGITLLRDYLVNQLHVRIILIMMLKWGSILYYFLAANMAGDAYFILFMIAMAMMVVIILHMQHIQFCLMFNLQLLSILLLLFL